MKRIYIDQFQAWSKAVADVILVVLCFLLAYSLKFKVGYVSREFFNSQFGHIYQHAQIEPYLQVLGIVAIVSLLSFYISGMYSRYNGILGSITEIVKVGKGMTIAVAQLMIISFFYRAFPGSRFVMIYFWVLGMVFISLSRVIYHYFNLIFHRRGVWVLPIIIVGQSDQAQDIAIHLANNIQAGYKLAGFIADSPAENILYNLKPHYRYLGKLDSIEANLGTRNIHAVFVIDYLDQAKWISQICEKYGVKFYVFSGLSDISLRLVDIDDIPMLTICESPLKHYWNRVAKRVTDILISGSLLIILSPLILTTVILIKVFMPGPIFYRQERIGRDGKVFEVIKFRSMIVNAEVASGPVMTSTGDERVTKLGNLIRKTSIDEIPQFWNVLKGEMSIVGPRPERPFFVEQFRTEYPRYIERLKVKPGITGWAQINGRSGLSQRVDEKLLYDLYYIDHWSLLLDIKIILRTFMVVLSLDQAY